jgi:alpha-L-fucosidase
VGFEYQVYGGFATAMHNTRWLATDFRELDAPGEFVMHVGGLKAGQTLQFRAVVRHPQVTLRGNHQRVTPE